MARFQALLDETAPAIVPPQEPNALAPPPSWADASEDLARRRRALGQAPPPFDPGALDRTLSAVREGWEGGSHPLTPEAEAAVNEGGPVGRWIVNPFMRLVGGVPSAIFRGGQQAVAETVGQVTGSPGLGRDVAAIPEALQGTPHLVTPRALPGDAVPPPTVLERALADQSGGMPQRRRAAVPEPAPAPEPAPVPGVEERVSTRIPTNVGAPDAHASPDFIIDRDSAKLGNAYDKNAAHMQGEDYPDLKVKDLTGPDKIFDAASDHIQSNLLHIYNGMIEKFGPEMVDRAKKWYDGANAIAHKWAEENGYTPRQVAGMLANLSPQKDWFQNVDLGRRLLKITGEQGETKFTADMNRWFEGYLDAKAKGATEKQMTNLNQLNQRVKALQGIPFDALGPADRAIFARAFDEAYHGKSYQIVAPEGDIGGTVLTGKGEPRKMGWGGLGEISKALQSLRADDLPTISRTLGDNHKVRNFYNNIMSPNSPFGDVTIDTHAIAAAHMRPLGGEHAVVKRGLGMGGSHNNFIGSKGLYPVYADAYRGLAKDLGLLPRELQSITWEGGRGLFSDVQKRDASFLKQNEAYWQAFQRGEIDAAKARSLIHEHAKGIDAPAWWTGRGS